MVTGKVKQEPDRPGLQFLALWSQAPDRPTGAWGSRDTADASHIQKSSEASTGQKLRKCVEWGRLSAGSDWVESGENCPALLNIRIVTITLAYFLEKQLCRMNWRHWDLGIIFIRKCETGCGGTGL